MPLRGWLMRVSFKQRGNGQSLLYSEGNRDERGLSMARQATGPVPGRPVRFLVAPAHSPGRVSLKTPATIYVIQCSHIHIVGDHIMPIAIIVHGGAGNLPPDRIEAAQAGCKEAALVGWRILLAGGSALDAVEAAVRSLEDNPLFNAGTGACLTSEGKIELDAGIMEGHTLQVGAVAGIELIKNPISLARRVMESPHVLLVGKGAQVFAQEQGIPLCAFEDLLTERQYQIWLENKAQAAKESVEEPRYHRREVGSIPPREDKHGTVGAVTVDMS